MCRPSLSRRLDFPMDTEGVTVRKVLFIKYMLVMLEKIFSSLNCDSVRGHRGTLSLRAAMPFVFNISIFTGKKIIYVFVKYFEWL